MDEGEDVKNVLELIRLQNEALSGDMDIYLSDSDHENEDSTSSNGHFEVSLVNTNELTNKLEVPLEVLPDRSEQRDVNTIATNALTANVEYEKQLTDLENELKKNLKRVEEKLEDVELKLKNSNGIKSTSANLKSNWIYIFGMPYFKDRNYYPSPPNADFKTKAANNEITWFDIHVRQWTPDQKKRLLNSVETMCLKQSRAAAEKQLELMKKKLENTTNEDEIIRLNNEIEDYNVEATAKNNLKFYMDSSDHDWMQISTKYLEGKHTPTECSSFWNLYLHPKFNKSAWTKQEEANLRKLAESHKFQNWDEIAKSLNTNRSGYQCFIVYQTKLNVKHRNPWTQEEDDKLVRVIGKHRIGNYIPWGKIAYEMDGRTKTQTFNRWTYSLNPAIKKGRFTKEEDVLIMTGVQMWGEEFKRIAYYMRDRTTSQVRDRYRNYLSGKNLQRPWTVADDKLLIEYVKEFGNDWSNIAKKMVDRDRTTIRHRYSTLNRWRERNPTSPLEHAPTRKNPSKNDWASKELRDWAKSVLSKEPEKNNHELKGKSKTNTARPPVQKVMKLNSAEANLLNFFRCSYPVPPGIPRRNSVSEVTSILNLMDAKIVMPTSGIENTTLDASDLEAIKEYFANQEVQEMKQDNSHPPRKSTPIEEIERPATPPDIDYVCPLSPSSTSLDLDFTELADIDFLPKTDEKKKKVSNTKKKNNTEENVPERIKSKNIISTAAQPIRRSTVVDVKPKVHLMHVCPPNFSTLVGLRTFLLNRRTLTEQANHMTEYSLALSDRDKYREAKDLFLKRLSFLFLWPAIMSRYPPTPTAVAEQQNEALFDPNADVSIRGKGNTRFYNKKGGGETSQPQSSKTLVSQFRANNPEKSSVFVDVNNPVAESSRKSGIDLENSSQSGIDYVDDEDETVIEDDDIVAPLSKRPKLK